MPVSFDTALASLERQIDGLLTDHRSRLDELQRQVDAIDLAVQRGAIPPAAGGGDWAAAAVKTFREHRDGFERHGRVRFTVPLPLEQRAIVSAGLTAPVPYSSVGLAAAAPYGQLRRLLPVAAADGASIFLVRENSSTGWQASPQVETQPKQESTVTLTGTTIPVEVIATWIACSTQALSDVIGLEAFIRQRLVWALEAKFEEQLLLGSGVSPNLTGLFVHGMALDTTLLGSSWNLADVIFAATVQCKLSGFSPDFAVLHPRDAYRLRRAKDSEGRYLDYSPLSLPQIIESPALAEGTFLCGDSRQAVIRMRQDVTIEISTEHEDFFTKNMAAIRAELRAALQIVSPSAFVKGNFVSSPA